MVQYSALAKCSFDSSSLSAMDCMCYSTPAPCQAADIVSIGEILQHDRTVNSGAVQQDALPQAPLEHSFAIGTTLVAGTIEVLRNF